MQSPAVELSWLSIICLTILRSFASKLMSASCFSGMRFEHGPTGRFVIAGVIFLRNCWIPHILPLPSAQELLQEIWICMVYLLYFLYDVLLSTDILKSKIFFSDFGNIFPYFLIWSGNKFESPWNFQRTPTDWQTLNNWNMFYQCKIIFFFDFENIFNGNVSVLERHQRNEKVIFAKLKVSTDSFAKNSRKKIS